MLNITYSVIVILYLASFSDSWGFFAHEKINRLAVFTLPEEMFGFYKSNIAVITEKATAPDARRYIADNEAPRHYIDLDVYGDSAFWQVPHNWYDAVEKYSMDSLNAYGIVPWHINFVKYQLTEAFKEKNANSILRLSADLGHYIADAHVPLHTTENYNGQLTGQTGIHGFWESRLPELFFENYDLLTGHVIYIDNAQEQAWEIVWESHQALDSVLGFERELTARIDAEKKYGYEQRANQVIRVYSAFFSERYHQRLAGMVERRLKSSILMVGSYWYTSWVDAGQPDLSELFWESEQDTARFNGLNRIFLRNHESGTVVEEP